MVEHPKRDGLLANRRAIHERRSRQDTPRAGAFLCLPRDSRSDRTGNGRRHSMVTIQPKVAAAGRYTVKQTIKLLGISRSTLHRHTEAGKIHCGYRKSTLQKFYKGSEITKYWYAEA